MRTVLHLSHMITDQTKFISKQLPVKPHKITLNQIFPFCLYLVVRI